LIVYNILDEDGLVPPLTSPGLEKRPVSGAVDMMAFPRNLTNERTSEGNTIDQFLSAVSLLFERNK
jgi:hypothetical protein